MCNLLAQLTDGIEELKSRLDLLNAEAEVIIILQRLLIEKNQSVGKGSEVTLPDTQTTSGDALTAVGVDLTNRMTKIPEGNLDTSKAWVCCGCQGMNNTTDDPCWRCQTKCCDGCLLKKK